MKIVIAIAKKIIKLKTQKENCPIEAKRTRPKILDHSALTVSQYQSVASANETWKAARKEEQKKGIICRFLFFCCDKGSPSSRLCPLFQSRNSSSRHLGQVVTAPTAKKQNTKRPGCWFSAPFLHSYTVHNPLSRQWCHPMQNCWPWKEGNSWKKSTASPDSV